MSIWALTRYKFNSFIERVMRAFHIDTKFVLRWYSIILFVAPLLFWAMLEFQNLKAGKGMANVISGQPTIAIAILVAFTDFIVGYYLWFQRSELLKDAKDVRIFFICQAICQLFVGNILCVLLSLLGIKVLAMEKEDGIQRTDGNPIFFKYVVVASTLMLVFCIALLGLLFFRLRG